MRLLRRRKVRCPDGTVKSVYRHVDDAFPLSLSTSSTQLKANIDAVQTLTASAESTYTKTIQGMLYAISQKNESLMMSFRALYILYQDDPCTSGAIYTNGVTQLITEQSRLNDVSVRLQALAVMLQSNHAPSDAILTHLMEIIERVGHAPPAVNGTITNLAIEEGRATIQKWIASSTSGNEASPVPADDPQRRMGAGDHDGADRDQR